MMEFIDYFCEEVEIHIPLKRKKEIISSVCDISSIFNTFKYTKEELALISWLTQNNTDKDFASNYRKCNTYELCALQIPLTENIH